MKNLLVIAGPTASGKTALAEAVAACYHCPIISADSRQFYKEIPIGTAQPSKESLQKFEYHFVGHLSLQEEMSAGQFEREAGAKIISLFEKQDLVIVCGGSGLYIKALLEGLDALPEKDEALRNELIELYKNEGLDALVSRLPNQIYESLNASDQLNPQRLMRHIEIAELPIAQISEEKPNPWRDYKKQVNINIIYTALSPDREKLYQQINQRVLQMMAEGFEAEVRNIPLHLKELNALRTVGYKEMFEYLCGEISLERATELTQQHTRNYAKKQLTWLRREKNIRWFDTNDTEVFLDFLRENIQ